MASKKHRKSRLKKAGAAPGTLVYIGDIKTQQPAIHILEYGPESLHEKQLTQAELANYQRPPSCKLWLNVYGLHETSLIAELGKCFGLHPLVMEDILNTNQRPKVESYGDYLYIVLHHVAYDSVSDQLQSEQISIILGRDYVLTFQERPTGCFEPVRERLRNGRVHIREAGTDYLAYALLDAAVDQYFSTLEKLGDECEELEEQLLHAPSNQHLLQLHKLKGQSMELRRSIWPLREAVNQLVRNDDKFFAVENVVFLRDVYDHTIHLIESLEAIRDQLGSMLDIYMSSISNRVNMEVRALTVVTMLFMPATLITGIFGMNFDSMPWLKNPNGFWWTLSVMAVVASSMGLLFWRRQWLSRH
ncbi:magnesium/cobalt transporter CorA [Methylovorus menthalis]|uniref:magnesium/cobalt transporter CorA n=1 Tax=Methylovorus menthalis TaxID=1002227 RepID=UPI001E2AA99C|nr:magnesium/cobalt transporter CorA [Methylovorus menthalis]MCB4810542.1 magnesium/cobalt transporter CorA [Methylovorus menthalis]